MFVLFMVAIYVNYRSGYRHGIFNGHEYGVYETVSWLIANGYMSGVNASTGDPATAKELTDKLMVELDTRRPELTYEDMK